MSVRRPAIWRPQANKQCGARCLLGLYSASGSPTIWVAKVFEPPDNSIERFALPPPSTIGHLLAERLHGICRGGPRSRCCGQKLEGGSGRLRGRDGAPASARHAAGAQACDARHAGLLSCEEFQDWPTGGT
eukprot:5733673-Amphidinium_carterae.2